MITAADVTPVLFFVNGVQITRRYDRKLDYGLQFYIQESPSLSVKFRVFKFTMKSLRFKGKLTMHQFDTENILP